MSDLGFIGLRIMGSPMADHLLKAGRKVSLCTRSEIPKSLLDTE